MILTQFGASLTAQGVVGCLVKGLLGRELDLSFDERTRIQQERAKIKAEYEKKIAQARKEAVESLIRLVPKEDRELMKSRVKPLLDDEANMLDATKYDIFGIPRSVPKKIPTIVIY